MLWEWKLVQRFIFCLSSTQCKEEFVKPRYFELQFDDLTVKTIYSFSLTEEENRERN